MIFNIILAWKANVFITPQAMLGGVDHDISFNDRLLIKLP